MGQVAVRPFTAVSGDMAMANGLKISFGIQ